jgi:hypothetical protein
MPTSKQHETLNNQLNKRLLTYMAAAGAAGVSMLAMAHPANAKVVYTPADRPLTWHGSSNFLDLNNDGIPDFGFFRSGLGNNIAYSVLAFKANRIMSNGLPLAEGVSVGQGETFNRPADRMLEWCECSGENIFSGPWAGVQNEYMGYEFVIQGAVHFGWARFSVTDEGMAKLAGYAYETVSRKPIVTGDTTGSDDDESVDQPDTVAAPESWPVGLGQLARGAAGQTAQ